MPRNVRESIHLFSLCTWSGLYGILSSLRFWGLNLHQSKNSLFELNSRAWTAWAQLLYDNQRTRRKYPQSLFLRKKLSLNCVFWEGWKPLHLRLLLALYLRLLVHMGWWGRCGTRSLCLLEWHTWQWIWGTNGSKDEYLNFVAFFWFFVAVFLHRLVDPSPDWDCWLMLAVMIDLWACCSKFWLFEGSRRFLYLFATLFALEIPSLLLYWGRYSNRNLDGRHRDSFFRFV